MAQHSGGLLPAFLWLSFSPLDEKSVRPRQEPMHPHPLDHSLDNCSPEFPAHIILRLIPEPEQSLHEIHPLEGRSCHQSVYP